MPQTGPNVRLTDNGRFQDMPKLLTNPYLGTSAFSDDTVAGKKKLDTVDTHTMLSTVYGVLGELGQSESTRAKRMRAAIASASGNGS